MQALAGLPGVAGAISVATAETLREALVARPGLAVLHLSAHCVLWPQPALLLEDTRGAPIYGVSYFTVHTPQFDLIRPHLTSGYANLGHVAPRCIAYCCIPLLELVMHDVMARHGPICSRRRCAVEIPVICLVMLCAKWRAQCRHFVYSTRRSCACSSMHQPGQTIQCIICDGEPS